jgi:drug/metabolite transporter (DMT)-like permease
VAVTLMQFGYGHTSVTNAGFLVNTSAVLTPALAWLLFRQRLPAWTWPAGTLTVLGAFLMSGGTLDGIGLGDALCLLSATAFGLWTLLLGRHVMRHRCPHVITAMQLTVCGIVTLSLGAIVYGVPSFASMLAAWPEILVMGVISKALAYVLNAMAQQHISASCASVIVSSEAVFGATLASLLLGEHLDATRAVGACLVLAGVVLVALKATPVPQGEGMRPSPAGRTSARLKLQQARRRNN